jgi:hypothetical protein
MKKTLVFLLSVFLVIGLHSMSHAKVTGACANCHTMHNSQGGNPIALEGTDVGWSGGELQGGISAPAAAPALLVSSCLGCHSSQGSESFVEIGGSRIPIVYNIVPPAQPLAGGNFYWVKTDDSKGHNVFPGEGDDNLSTAPGESNTCSGNSCHSNLHLAYTGSLVALNGRQGCTGCHMLYNIDQNHDQPKGFHHANDGDPGSEIKSFPWYRFLTGHLYANDDGVRGIEDADWEADANESKHNEYLGQYQSGGNQVGWELSVSRTMTAFCCGCHGNFHQQEQDGTWIRHPSDAIIPNSGEYAAYTSYNPQIPVARSDLNGGISPTVTPGEDLVMCLSCHRAHGSPYYKHLRWDYKSTTLSEALYGCGVCHTAKQ